MTAPEPTLPPERVEELAEALGSELDVAAPLGHIFGPEVGDAAEVLLAQEVEHATHAALAPLVAGWLAEDAGHLPDGDAWVERRRADGAAEVRARMEAAIRLVSPDHITPMGARQILAALATEPEEQP